MKTKLLIFCCGIMFLSQQVKAQGCPANLFFSEYIEGSSFNKVIEIYNPLPYTVDLNDYVLELYTNGSSTPSAQFFMGDTIAPNQKYIICHPTADAPVLSIADTTSGVLNFNGDDAFILKHEFTFDTLDIIGVVGVDPGTSCIVHPKFKNTGLI
ncbi:MAG: lamin tail domain-containing protein [Crocinitomicaceae bacterium]|nr:lamin tail domain-containing protein [Crocinitomicaceae bacterium]